MLNKLRVRSHSENFIYIFYDSQIEKVGFREKKKLVLMAFLD